MKRKSVANKSDQSARLIEAAKKVQADESGKAFEKALKKVLAPQKKKAP